MLSKSIIYFGSREESDVAGLFIIPHIWMMGYFRLGQVRVNGCPAGLEAPASARNRRKATVKIPRYTLDIRWTNGKTKI